MLFLGGAARREEVGGVLFFFRFIFLFSVEVFLVELYIG